MSTILLLAISIAILNLSEARLRILSIGHGSFPIGHGSEQTHSVILGHGLFMDPIAHRSDCTPTQLHTDPIVHRSDCAYSIRRNSDRKKENIK